MFKSKHILGLGYVVAEESDFGRSPCLPRVPPIIEASAELTGISTRALFGLCGLCGSSYVIVSIPKPQLVKMLYGI